MLLKLSGGVAGLSYAKKQGGYCVEEHLAS